MIYINYTNKLENALKLSKNYSLHERFLLIKDLDGWTDGFIADLTNLNTETMKAKAQLMGDKLERKQLDRELCPEFKKIIPDGGEEVTDVEWNLNGNWLTLKSENQTATINPTYLKYFQETYKQVGGVTKLVIIDSAHAVKVFGNMPDDSLIGLIMPIRV